MKIANREISELHPPLVIAEIGINHGGDLDVAKSMVRMARDAGCESFNFMSSPADQPSLVQYKEKWGGETRAQRTYTLRLSAVYSIFRFAERAYSLIS